MSAEEWVAWQALDRLVAPIGAERADRHTALLATLLANIHRDAKREAYTLDDFDLYRIPPTLTRAQEEEQFRAAWDAAGLVVKGS